MSQMTSDPDVLLERIAVMVKEETQEAQQVLDLVWAVLVTYNQIEYPTGSQIANKLESAFKDLGYPSTYEGNCSPLKEMVRFESKTGRPCPNPWGHEEETP